jgi:NAD dependent epimerase/dehydratase
LILVTGADGFIGSHLVERLARDGERVRAFAWYDARGSRGWLDELSNDLRGAVDVVSGDVRDASTLRSAMRGCDRVAHLAALISIPYSYRSPGAYLETNVLGTLHVLEAARDLELDRVVQISTSEVYGTARSVPIREDHPLNAQSPYAASKIAADQLALSFQRSFGTPVTIVRPFNTYGPRQSARAVIPTLLAQVLAGRRSVKLGSLHPTRDFSYVEDTARGIALALHAEDIEGEVIQLGTGFEISIGALVELVGAELDVEIEVVQDDQRLRPAASEVERLCASNEKAERRLGWKPEYAGLDGLRRGIHRTAEWLAARASRPGAEPDRYDV